MKFKNILSLFLCVTIIFAIGQSVAASASACYDEENDLYIDDPDLDITVVIELVDQDDPEPDIPVVTDSVDLDDWDLDDLDIDESILDAIENLG